MIELVCYRLTLKKFIRVTLVNKIIYVSGDNSIIHHLYIVLCVPHLESSFLPSPFILLIPSSTSPTLFPSGNHHTVSMSIRFLLGFFGFFFFCWNPSLFSPSLPLPSPLTVVSMFSISMSLFLFCLWVYFVY